MMSKGPFTPRFSAYFDRQVAQKAASSLSDGVEIELKIEGSDSQAPETLTFTRSGGKNIVRDGSAKGPQIVFTLSPGAAEAILSDASEDIGAIGVQIARLILAPQSGQRIQIFIHAGFLSLFSKGYFGVVAAGGASFAAYLASRGLNGIGALKTALKKKG